MQCAVFLVGVGTHHSGKHRLWVASYKERMHAPRNFVQLRTRHLRVMATLCALQTGVKQRGKYSLYPKLIIRFIYEISATGIFLAEAIYGKKEGSFRT